MAEEGTPFVWAHKWEDDPRNPLVTFQVFDKHYGFYFFSIPLWIQMLGFIVAETLVAAVVAVFFYHFVVRKAGTTNAYLIGYSVFVPFWIFPRCREQLGLDKIFLLHVSLHRYDIFHQRIPASAADPYDVLFFASCI
jgi:uncharacterized membrane protein (UPF0182 family)